MFECELHKTADYWVGHLTEDDLAFMLLAGQVQTYGQVGRWVDNDLGGLWLCTAGKEINE